MMEISMSLLLYLALMKMLWVFCGGVLYNTGDCNDSCSHEVNCTIRPDKSGFCGSEGIRTNADQGPDISAGPVDLSVQTVQDADYQYIHLSWKPPLDGSYNYLIGFIVQVTVISLDRIIGGLTGTTCYKVIPSPHWFETHRSLQRQGGVVFFMNCLRFPIHASLDVVISIHSLPLKKDSPKLAMTNLTFAPDAIYWNPRFDKWADTDNVMHLLVQNPLKEAKFYSIKVKAVEKGLVVFTHTFPALDVLDEKKNILAHIHRVQTNPFTLNFTSTELAPSSPLSHQLDNRVIIVVSTAVVVSIALLVCLVWKGVVRPSKLRNLVRNCAVKLSGRRKLRYISFTPIYCYENENFVGAVENHVSLLRHCLDGWSAEAVSQSDISSCCAHGSRQSWVDATNSVQNIIIYLSPRLEEIVNFGRVPPSHCCKLDVQCHQALLSLYELCQKGQGPIPVVVTFDCFKQAELSVLIDLMTWISPAQPSRECDLLTPVKLASFTSSGWTLENTEQVLARFPHPSEFLPHTAESFQGWKETAQVRAVERYLSLLGESADEGDKELTLACQEESCSISENCNTSFYSHVSPHCPKTLARSVSDHLGKNLHDSEFANSQDGVTFLPDAPLISNSSGFHSGSDFHVSSNFMISVPLTNNYNTCSRPGHDTTEPSPKRTDMKEKVISQTHYDQNQTEPHTFFPHGERSLPIKDGRTNINLHNIVIYKPNNLGNKVDTSDAFSVHSVESDSLLRSNDLSGCARSVGQYFKDVSDDLDWGNQRVVKTTGSIIPPSLSHSNFTSMESVCERINRVNEHSGWSELNLSK